MTEAYEMTRSHSEGTEEEYDEANQQTRLLNKEEASDTSDLDVDEEDDEEWAIIVDESEGHDYEKDNPTLRYVCIGFAIGLFFIIFKVAMTKFSHDPDHKERGAEKLYYNGSDYFAATVILISLDGFRPDYMNRDVTPRLRQFADQGIMAKYMHPAFPPSTFPNHWTLVTGLYPESHGIVANSFYDPDLKMTFSHTNHTSTSDHRWWKGEPIWTTSKMHRQRTGSIMWPGSDTNYNPPDLLVKYNSSMTTREKMDLTLQWLDLPYNDRPQMITMYCPEVDQEGHRHGIHGNTLDGLIQQLDTDIGYLQDELQKRELDQHVHVVIVSDHGMSTTSNKKLIYYDEIVSSDLLKYVHREALPLLDFRLNDDAPKDTIDKIYQQLLNYTLTQTDPHFEVYLKQNLPERFHYKHSTRITPIITIPEVGYTFVTHSDHFSGGGNHGYDNLADDMRAIFLAQGPKISRVYKPGSVLAPFFNTEVYTLLTELLNMEGASNNGTLNADFPTIYQPPF